MSTLLMYTAIYIGVSYFLTLGIYKWRKIDATRQQILLRSIVSGAIFFALMYFLGL